MAPGLLGMLEPPFSKPFPNFLNYKSNRNTLKYTVLLRNIIDDIMECNKEYYTDNGTGVWIYKQCNIGYHFNIYKQFE